METAGIEDRKRCDDVKDAVRETDKGRKKIVETPRRFSPFSWPFIIHTQWPRAVPNQLSVVKKRRDTGGTAAADEKKE